MSANQNTITSTSAIGRADLPLLTFVLLFDSMHYIYAKLLASYVSPDISAAYVMGVAAVQVGLYGLITRQISLAALRENKWFFVTIGALIGASTYLGYLAVTFIDPGTASMLTKVSTVFSLALGILWLGERFSPIQLLGAAVAIVGSFVIAYQPDAQLRWGALLLVFGSFCYSAHFAVVKRYGNQMGFLDFFFYRLLSTAAILFVMSAARQVLTWPTLMGWGIIILTATFDVTASRAFYYWALRRLDMGLLSVITTLTPVATIVWALLLFDTTPGLRQLIGGITVLIGVLIVTYMPRKAT
ncbi:MAG: DMT family transporter [Caldilineaceae bacterium]